MSNARSPREVCSTTMGTSGLTVLASFRFERSSPAQLRGLGARRQPSNRSTAETRLSGGLLLTSAGGCPELTRGGPALLAAGRPELVARPCLLDRDRLRGVGDEVERLALGEVVLEALSRPVDFRRSSSFFGDVRPGPSPAAS